MEHSSESDADDWQPGASVMRFRFSIEPPLVGRMTELRTLHEQHRALRRGECSLVGVRGSAGVGKSRLVRDFAADCRRRGTRVLSSRCSESLSSPLMPLVRLLVHAASDESVAAATRRRCEDEIQRLGSDEYQQDTADRKGRLFLDLVDLLAAVAAGQPTMFVIDDVQWADPLTGEFIEFFADELADAPGPRHIMLVLTERSVASSPSLCARQIPWIRLGGLDPNSVRLLVGGLGIERPSPTLLSELQRVTRGNALHLMELVRHLASEGGIVEHDGLVELRNPLTARAPDDLVDTIARRLDSMSEPVRELVQAAAVVGDEVDVIVLEAMLEWPADHVGLAIDDATQRGVLERTADRVIFTHPIHRQILESRLGRRQRARLHGRAAAAMLALDQSSPADIAPHLVIMGAGPEVDPERTADVLAAAARQSFGMAAWDVALRYFLAALDGHRGDKQARGWLHYEAGRSAELSYQWAVAEEHYLSAAELAAVVDDHELAAWATISQLHASTVGGHRVLEARVDAGSVERLLGRLTTTDGPTAVVARSQYSQTLSATGEVTAARRYAEEARSMAIETGDDDSLVKAEMTSGLAASFALDVEMAIRHYQDGIAVARRIGDQLRAGHGLTRVALLLLTQGQLDRAQAMALEGWAANMRTRQWSDLALLASVLAQISLLRGDFTSVESWGREAEHYLDLSEYPFVPGVLFPVKAAAAAMQGDDAEVSHALDQWSARTGSTHRASRHVFEQWSRTAPTATGQRDVVNPSWSGNPQLPNLARLLLAAETAVDPDRAAPLLAALSTVTDDSVVFAPGSILSLPRARLRLAAVAGAAEPHQFDDELNRCQVTGAKLAWCLAMADRAMVRDRDDSAAALDDLTVCWRTATALGATAVAARAEALAHRIDPSHVLGQGETLPRTCTVLFVDMAGSTAIAVESDERYVELMDRELEIVRRRTAEHGGSEFGTAGDAILASFRDDDDAVACALDVQEDVLEGHTRGELHGLELKIGIAAGPLLERDGQLYGHVVNLSARLSDRASAGQVVTTMELARGLTRSVEVASHGRAELKGFDEPFELVTIRRANGAEAPQQRSTKKETDRA